jgi:opacity protein-like surface antigen
MHQYLIRLAAASLLCAAPAMLFAQAPPPASPWSFSIEGGFAAQQETDFKDSEGDFSVDRVFIGAGLDYRWNFRNSLGISIGGGNSDYTFGGLEGEAPWDKIENRRVSLVGRFGFGETGSIFIIPTLRFNGESGASSSDSRNWGLLGGVAWRINADLTIGPGIGVFDRIEDSTRVFPILLIDWNFGERWNLSTGRGLAASQGPGLTLSYNLSPAWSFGLSGRYEEVQFRLDDEGPAPGGVGTDQSLPLVLSAAWEPSSAVSLSIFAGMEFAGELEWKNANGEVLSQQDYDAAPIIGATFKFEF